MHGAILPRAAALALGLSVLACQDPGSASPTSDSDPGVVRRETPVGGQLLDQVPVPVAPVQPQQPIAGDLALMTFNIRLETSADGANIWANRKAQLFTLVRALDPDVAGYQEVLPSQLSEMKINIPGYTVVGVGRDDGRNSGEYSPVFYRSARFSSDTSGTFWFSDTPEVPGSKSWGNNITRICSWAHLIEKTTGRGFYFFNVHLDHESQPSREKSVQLLVDRIGKVKHPSEPVFVTGDFNVGETDPVIRWMKGKTTLGGKSNPIPFLDSFRMVDSTSTAVGTFHDFTGTTQGAKIDYVFVLPRIKTVAAAIVRSNQSGKYPSDHFPVTASVTVPEWASTSIRRP